VLSAACYCALLLLSYTNTTAARKEMCRLFGDVIAARRKAGAAAAESKTDMLQIFMDLKYKVWHCADTCHITFTTAM
jgi:hypothetical protein